MEAAADSDVSSMAGSEIDDNIGVDFTAPKDQEDD